MKKFLEVLVDEDGKFHFSTDEVFLTEEEFAAEDCFAQLARMEEYDNLLKRLIRDMTEFMWKNKDQQVSQAIRSLSMAEILGCADPYDRAEEFWSLMMFHTIPQFDHFATSIKQRYGFDAASATRPCIGGTLPAGGPMSPIIPFAPLGPTDSPVDGSLGSVDILSFPIPQPASKVVS